MIALLLAAALPLLPGGTDRMPAQLGNTRVAAAVMAEGDVLDLGVGAGYVMRTVMNSSAVVSYTGVEIDPRIAQSRKLELKHRLNHGMRAEVVEAEALEYLSNLQRQFDVVFWDIDPILDPTGTEAVVAGTYDGFPWLEDVLYRIVKPGGMVITWHPGTGVPQTRRLRLLRAVTIKNGEGNPVTIAVHTR